MLARLHRFNNAGWLIALAMMCADGAVAARWHRAVSDNFIVYSDLPEEDVGQLAVDLEYFRMVLNGLLGLPAGGEPLRMELYAFRNARDYNDTVPFPDTAGVYSAVSGVPRALLIHNAGRRWEEPGRQVLFHEYVHHMMGRFTAYELPAWYEEGFAEYLSTFEIDGDVALIGKPPHLRAYVLGQFAWMDTEQLFVEGMRYLRGDRRARRMADDRKGAVRTSEQTMLYAMGWLVAYYLNRDPDLSARTVDYLRLLNAGEAPAAAFPKAFDRSFDELHMELRAFWDAGELSYRGFALPSGAEAPQVTVEALPISDTDYWITEAQVYFAYHTRPERMARKFERALDRLDGDEVEMRLRTVLNLAELQNDLEELDEADRWLAEARRLDATSPRLAYEQGRNLLRRALAAGGDAAARRTSLQALRSVAGDALERHPSDARLLWILARSYVFDDSADATAGVQALATMREVYPQHPLLNGYVALLEAEAGRHEQALASLDFQLRFARTQQAIETFEQIRESVVAHRDAGGGPRPIASFFSAATQGD